MPFSEQKGGETGACTHSPKNGIICNLCLMGNAGLCDVDKCLGKKDWRKEFAGNFMNNGVRGVLDDEFQDSKMLLIRNFISKLLESETQKWFDKGYRQGRLEGNKEEFQRGYFYGEQIETDKVRKQVVESLRKEISQLKFTSHAVSATELAKFVRLSEVLAIVDKHK